MGNVALLANGATCTTSSEYNQNFNCEKALDGIALPNGNEWATDMEGVGSWLKIVFNAICK